MNRSIENLKVIAEHYQSDIITYASLTSAIIELTKTEAEYKERITNLEHKLKEHYA